MKAHLHISCIFVMLTGLVAACGENGNDVGFGDSDGSRSTSGGPDASIDGAASYGTGTSSGSAGTGNATSSGSAGTGTSGSGSGGNGSGGESGGTSEATASTGAATASTGAATANTGAATASTGAATANTGAATATGGIGASSGSTAGATTGSGLDASAEAGVPCGSTTCPAVDRCCDHCTGQCVNALSGANCPDDGHPNRTCADASAATTGGGTTGSIQDGAADAPIFTDAGACPPCASTEICVKLDITHGAEGRLSWGCVPNPCGAAALSCSCAASACQAYVPAPSFCSVGTATDTADLLCQGGGICVSPDTPIATPDGYKPIQDLVAGDLVYSVDHGAMRVVPLLGVHRTRVAQHRVVRIVLETGAVLEVTAAHPLADGRPFGALAIGDTLDGHRVVEREVIPYAHPFTYDILPASDTGTYVASGLVLGSTLR